MLTLSPFKVKSFQHKCKNKTDKTKNISPPKKNYPELHTSLRPEIKESVRKEEESPLWRQEKNMFPQDQEKTSYSYEAMQLEKQQWSWS